MSLKHAINRGAESGKSLVVFRPDAETAAAPTGNGWYALTGATQMDYVDDGLRYDALRIDATSGGQYDAVALIGEDMPEGNVNPNDADWAEADRRHLGFWMRNADGRAVKLSVHTDTTFDDETKIEIMTASGTDGYNGFTKIYSIYLGTALNDGQWHYVELDLKSRVAALNASDTIQAFNGMRVECNDLYLDDIVLSGGEVHRSYQLIPGAAIGAALGAQDGGDGVALGERWYYHYDDLGSVVAMTDAAGAQVGVYVPDHWGNYRLVIGTRPDTMGLTGKFFDADAGLYYFNARWYDPERGRFVSESPLSESIEFQFSFSKSDPINRYDVDGLLSDVSGGSPEQREIARRALHRACKTIWAANSIPGVPARIHECMKDACTGAVDFGIKIGGLWCRPGKAGYRRRPYDHVHVCSWVVQYNPNDPVTGPRTVDPFLDHTIAHEMVHRCGCGKEGEYDPAEMAGKYVENSNNWVQ